MKQTRTGVSVMVTFTDGYDTWKESFKASTFQNAVHGAARAARKESERREREVCIIAASTYYVG